MHLGLIVLIVTVAWMLLSIVVALAVGGMAKARDAGALPTLDHGDATGRMAPPARANGMRTAV